MFIPEISSFAKTEPHKVTQQNIRRWRYKNSCRYCREKLSKCKAVIKCANPKCKCYYHIPCAVQKQIIFSLKFQKQFYIQQGVITNDNFNIPFYCSGHNKKLFVSFRKYLQEYHTKQNEPFQCVDSKENMNNPIISKYSSFGECEYDNPLHNIHYLDFTGHMNEEEINFNYNNYLSNLNDKPWTNNNNPFDESISVTLSTEELCCANNTYENIN